MIQHQILSQGYHCIVALLGLTSLYSVGIQTVFIRIQPMLTSILYTQNKIKNLKSFKYWSKKIMAE